MVGPRQRLACLRARARADKDEFGYHNERLVYFSRQKLGKTLQSILLEEEREPATSDIRRREACSGQVGAAREDSLSAAARQVIDDGGSRRGNGTEMQRLGDGDSQVEHSAPRRCRRRGQHAEGGGERGHENRAQTAMARRTSASEAAPSARANEIQHQNAVCGDNPTPMIAPGDDIQRSAGDPVSSTVRTWQGQRRAQWQLFIEEGARTP
jgi:hypothetical protein